MGAQGATIRSASSREGAAADVVDDLAAVAGVVDADTQAPEVAAAEHVDGVAQAVVTGVSPALLEAHGADRQVQLIVRDQDLFGVISK